MLIVVYTIVVILVIAYLAPSSPIRLPLMERKRNKELSAGQNDPAPGEFEDWDVQHPWADGSHRAGAIARLRRDVRTGVISQETYSVELDLIFEEKSSYWRGEMAERIKALKAKRGARRRLKEQFENGVMILPENDRTVEALLYQEQNRHLNERVKQPKQPLYVKRWRSATQQVQFLASEIVAAQENPDGSWTYHMRDGVIGPVWKDEAAAQIAQVAASLPRPMRDATGRRLDR